ncbi:MAG: hypothetical protein M0018_05545 [Nitrospiraceae bacterium]|nr:hypothetical protein [Nitrospiraceae bacterium]
MDKPLECLMEFASMRGSNCLKSKIPPDFATATAELGTLLLIFARELAGADESRTQEKMFEIQPYIDEYRKHLFRTKLNGKNSQ